jgi:hypothetical protein
MIRKPKLLPSFVLGVLLFERCHDCNRWGLWREMSDINPDVCNACLFDRMLAGIEAEARFRRMLEMTRAVISHATQYYKDRASADKLRREHAMFKWRMLLEMGKFDEANEAFKDILK